MPILLWLCVGHAICDFPLQDDFLSKGKNHRQPISGFAWQIMLFSHALIHAGMVSLVTGSLFLGMLELILHMFIDFLKCEGRFRFATDQALHYGCKVLYVILMYFSIA